MSESKKAFVYISSWGNFGGDPGLGLYQFDYETGALEFSGMLNKELSCNVTHVDHKRHVLYVVNETEHLPEAKYTGGGGRVFAYRIIPKTGELTEICHVPTYCSNPCYITLDAYGKYLLIVNHGSHSSVTKVIRDVYGKYRIVVEYDDAVVGLFPVEEDGSIGEPMDIVMHHGESMLKGQSHSSPHTAVMSPSGKLFAVCDIGEDRIYMYTIDRENNKLVLSTAPFSDIPGSTTRYCVFHPTLPYFYVNHEVGSMDVRCFHYDEDGKIEPICTVSSMPEGYVKQAHDEQQDFRIHPSGKYIYDVLNGPEMIAVFEVDEQTGRIRLIQNQKVDGIWARGCALTPDGRYLLVTCLKSGDVIVYKISEDGKLSPTGFRVNQPSASYISFYQP
jgi:6-phosphogluconolactonase (cycloisomerase 2 family)